MIATFAELEPHPATPCPSIHRFRVAIEASTLPRELGVRYQVDGHIDRLRLPAPGNARRCDGLWQHSCFELFLRPDGSDSYHEFNFAPSGDWAAYRFAGRRTAQSAPGMAPPRVEFHRHADACALTATVAFAELPELAAAAGLHAGVAAVVEADDGALSYWALAHGGDKPDFHDPASFTLRVTRP